MAAVRANRPNGKGVAGRVATGEDEDFLAEIIAERSKKDAQFPDLVDAALRRRELISALATKREELKLSQQEVARRMGTSQSAVARLEAGEVDAKLSTIERFATAVGHKIVWHLASEQERKPVSGVAEHASRQRANQRA